MSDINQKLRREITERTQAEEVLRESEEILLLFIEHAPAALAMVDSEMRYLVVSRRWMTDYSLEDRNIVGRSHYEIFLEIPDRWKVVHRRGLECKVVQTDEDYFQRTDGTIQWLRWEVRPWYKSGGAIGGIVIFTEDITKRKQAEEELKIINEELVVINRIITTTTNTGVQGILENVLDEALAITGLEGGTICLVTPDDILNLAAHRAMSEATIQDLTANVVKIGDCLCGECARDCKPLILADRAAILKFSTREATRGEDIQFHAAYPLLSGEKCLGVLCVFTRTDRKPLERRLKMLETVSLQIALAVENAQLYA